MNIFGTLSQSSGFIDKHNAAAFLAFLLNPNEEHGLSTAFLRNFLQEIQEIKGANCCGGGGVKQ